MTLGTSSFPHASKSCYGWHNTDPSSYWHPERQCCTQQQWQHAIKKHHLLSLPQIQIESLQMCPRSKPSVLCSLVFRNFEPLSMSFKIFDLTQRPTSLGRCCLQLDTYICGINPAHLKLHQEAKSELSSRHLSLLSPLPTDWKRFQESSFSRPRGEMGEASWEEGKYRVGWRVERALPHFHALHSALKSAPIGSPKERNEA